MRTIDVQVHRLSTVSQRPFEDVVSRLTAGIGRPDILMFNRALASAATLGDREKVVQTAVGSSNLMEFARFDVGEGPTKGTRRTRPQDSPLRRRESTHHEGNGQDRS